MNKLLNNLHSYPFERLNKLLEGISPSPDLPFIPLSLGEPKHQPAEFIVDMYSDKELITNSFMTYPPTRGIPELREAIVGFAVKRYKLQQKTLHADTNVLPVNGTREALFSCAQACISPQEESYTILPNPFYQIYEGAAVLAGSTPVYLPCLEENNFLPDFSLVKDEVWEKTRLVYICSPGNPTGSVMSLDSMQSLIRLSDQFNFIIASDECYSEIYGDDKSPPPGLLEACDKMGRHDFRNCMIFNSLSKRSNLPGLRSGFVAGDADIIRQFLLYRTYHGSAMPVLNQKISAAAWKDETHVQVNRNLYRDKFKAVIDILADFSKLESPEAGFFVWLPTPASDEKFTQDLFKEQNVKVLPGSYLSREADGQNPGANRIRIALVAEIEECIEAARRLRDFIKIC